MKEHQIMYAVVEIKGEQFKVQKDDEILAQKVEGEVGSQVTFDRVLMIGGEGDLKVGQPAISGASVQATITGARRGPKVVVFKKKKRRGYRRTRGHRQGFTSLKIDAINT
jgi:large subunit ribosomal protein L21